ncbi:MAG: allophanate hydrolase subunit 1 [Burkholderiaceae bacterium]|jgi:KipI family sensor histidine kinase inhibitor|nr:allophanate hydrolase subunit 1 [Burkholderiaceae bacterium]
MSFGTPRRALPLRECCDGTTEADRSRRMTTRRKIAARNAKSFAPRVVPAGDAAQMLELAEDFDADANLAAQRIADEVRAAKIEGITDVVAAIVTVTVHFEAADAVQAVARREAISQLLLRALERVGQGSDESAREPVHIPVCYESAFAPDLAEVAAATGLTPEEVVQRHVASPHRVLMIGFTPGFPYIGGLDERLAVPRRATPRARLEAGSVAIANGQTSIYPFATPGGWNLIGRTPMALFDPGRDPPTLLQAGDRIVFEPISASDFERLAKR